MGRPAWRGWGLGVLLWAAVGTACGNDTEQAGGQPSAAGESRESGEAIDAPVASLHVREDDPDVMWVWYDDQGAPHPVSAISEIPEARRAEVRVDRLGGEQAVRPPAGSLFVADLTQPPVNGEWVAKSVPREDFDARLRARVPLPEAPPPSVANAAGNEGEAKVTLYGTAWCGACKKARAFLRTRGIPFEDRDIEREPGARAELMEKARAAGMQTNGVPVIDVDGTLMQGFDPRRILSLLQ